MTSLEMENSRLIRRGRIRNQVRAYAGVGNILALVQHEDMQLVPCHSEILSGPTHPLDLQAQLMANSSSCATLHSHVGGHSLGILNQKRFASRPSGKHLGPQCRLTRACQLCLRSRSVHSLPSPALFSGRGCHPASASALRR